MKKFAKGFTVIELLLALALTAILTAALSQMIGQAARDRSAMQKADSAPVWTKSTVSILEGDLQQARLWAGIANRLILIGIGHDGLPAQIEYRWVDHEQTTALSRHEKPLTDENMKELAKAEPIALGFAGIAIGPYTLGDVPASKPDASGKGISVRKPEAKRSAPLTRARASVVIDGVRVPLQPLPDRVPIRINANPESSLVVVRELLR